MVTLIKPKREHYFLGGAVLVVAAIILIVIFVKPGATGKIIADDVVNVNLYVMSQCPYGVQAENTFAEVVEKFGDKINLNIEYIAQANSDGSFSSLHGEPEVELNIIQLCAKEYYPETYLDFIVCQNNNSGADSVELCAQTTRMNAEKIMSCAEGERGEELLIESIENSDAVGATASPTIIVNGEAYSGGRTTTDFSREICSFYNYEIEECSDVTKPIKLNMIVLNDERCADCTSVTNLYSQLRSLFPGLQIQEYDYSDAEGKALYDSLNLKYLPAMLFGSEIVNTSSYNQVRAYLVPVGNYYYLRIGSDFDPTSEICTNGIDDTDNGLIDCEDPECEGTIECRPEIENHVQVFIMSDCPYGREAIKAMNGVKDNFGDALSYEVHYIASETTDGFSSLHGQYEVDEDIVQLCVLEYSPEVWFDYMYCRSSNGVNGIDWKTCATSTGVDITSVETCFEGEEGKELLREDIKLAQGLGISASPTWLANNKYTFSGIDAETVKTQICKYNDLDGCENTLSSNSAASGSCG